LSYNSADEQLEEEMMVRYHLRTAILVLATLAAAGLLVTGCGDEEPALVAPEPVPEPGIVVYGRDTCYFTVRMVDWMNEEGLRFTYKDISDPDNHFEMYCKVRYCDWYEGGNVGIPIVDVDGVVLQGPTFEQVRAEL